MTAEKQKKVEVIKVFGKHEKDTGSMEVQAALCTERIKYLTEHLKTHKKDFSSLNGLNRLLSHRRSALQYLKRKNAERYQEVIKELGLRK